MKQILWYIIISQLFLNTAIFVYKIHQKKKQPTPPPVVQPETPFIKPQPQPEQVKPKPEPEIIQPEFKDFPPVRQGEGKCEISIDIDSHLTKNIYRDSDPITTAHEENHGISSDLRQKFGGTGKINGFYCLENKAVILDELHTTIQTVAQAVPQSLRGEVYNLYLIKQAADWGSTPSYILDEHNAYTNGSIVRLKLGISSRAETVKYMIEFDVYAITLAKVTNSNDHQFKSFLMWQLDRTMRIYNESLALGDLSACTNYLEKLRSTQDATELRQFAHAYFGEQWCQKTFGF